MRASLPDLFEQRTINAKSRLDTVFRIRVSLNADPDPGFYLDADPDSGFWTQKTETIRKLNFFLNF